MKYVLDSNVFKFVSSSELRKPNIDAWLATVDDSELCITVMTIQEAARGIELLRKRNKPEHRETVKDLEQNLQEYIAQYRDRILPLDTDAALEWGRRLASQGMKNANDLAILSIASTQEKAAVVTMNIDDFKNRGITLVDPSKKPALVIDPA